MIEELGVDAVMVGRAAMNNPYIFTQINHFFETGEELPELPFDKKLDIAEDHLKRLVDLKGEKIAVREFRGLAPHYLRGTAGAAKSHVPSLWLRSKKSLRLYDKFINDENLTRLVRFLFYLYSSLIVMIAYR